MANVVYGPIVTGVSGSVSGTTFQRAGSQTVIRRKPIPPKPTQSNQRSAQAELAYACSRWATLSDATKGSWASMAATVTLTNSLGQTYHPTAFQLYVMVLTCNHRVDSTETDATVPLSSGLALERVPTFSFATDDLSITDFAPAFSGAAFVLLSLFGPDVARAHNRMHRIAFVPWKLADGLPILLYNNISTGLSSGGAYRVWLKMRFTDDQGRPSLVYNYSYDFTAA